MAALLIGNPKRKNFLQAVAKPPALPTQQSGKWWVLILLGALVGTWLWRKESATPPMQAAVPSQATPKISWRAPSLPFYSSTVLVPERVDEQPLYCERAQSLMTRLCMEQKQENACWNLYQQAEADSFQQRLWLQKYLNLQRETCDEPEGQLAACWNLRNTSKEGSSEWLHARDRLMTMLLPLCQQEPNAKTCMDLYKLAPEGSAIRADARERFLELTQKPCDQGDRYACLELVDQTDASWPERTEKLKRFYAMSFVACETGDVVGCGGMMAAHRYQIEGEEDRFPLPTEQQLAVYHRACDNGNQRACWESSLLTTDRAEEGEWEAKAEQLAEEAQERACEAGSMEDCRQATSKPAQERYLAWAAAQCKQAENDSVCASLYLIEAQEGISTEAQQQNALLQEKYIDSHQFACENGEEGACLALQFAFPKNSPERAYWGSRSDRLDLFDCARGQHKYCDTNYRGFSSLSQEDQSQILRLAEKTCEQTKQACLFVVNLYNDLGHCKKS